MTRLSPRPMFLNFLTKRPNIVVFFCYSNIYLFLISYLCLTLRWCWVCAVWWTTFCFRKTFIIIYYYLNEYLPKYLTPFWWRDVATMRVFCWCAADGTVNCVYAKWWVTVGMNRTFVCFSLCSADLDAAARTLHIFWKSLSTQKRQVTHSKMMLKTGNMSSIPQ